MPRHRRAGFYFRRLPVTSPIARDSCAAAAGRRRRRVPRVRRAERESRDYGRAARVPPSSILFSHDDGALLARHE